MMGDFPEQYFTDVWMYADFARGMNKSEGNQHNKAGCLIVDLGWVATGFVSCAVLSSKIGSRADPRDDGPGRLLSWDDFWGESGMTITSVDEFVVVCMSVGFPPVNFPLVVFFWGLALVDFWEAMISSFRLKYVHFSKWSCGSQNQQLPL